jgi:hypothetical protein
MFRKSGSEEGGGGKGASVSYTAERTDDDGDGGDALGTESRSTRRRAQRNGRGSLLASCNSGERREREGKREKGEPASDETGRCAMTAEDTTPDAYVFCNGRRC